MRSYAKSITWPKEARPSKPKRVFLDTKVSHAWPSGYYVRCPQLKKAIENIENKTDSKVVGIVYDEENSIELILDPPIKSGSTPYGDDEE